MLLAPSPSPSCPTPTGEGNAYFVFLFTRIIAPPSPVGVCREGGGGEEVNERGRADTLHFFQGAKRLFVVFLHCIVSTSLFVDR